MADNKKWFGRLQQLGNSDWFEIELSDAEQSYASRNEEENKRLVQQA